MKSPLKTLADLLTGSDTGAPIADRFKLLLSNPLYSNAFFLMLCNIFNAIFGFVFWILVARIYSDDDVGLASALIAASSLLVLLSGLGLQYGLIRFIKTAPDPSKLINSNYTITVTTGLLAGVIFIIGLGFWSPALLFVRENPLYLAFFLLAVPVISLATLTDYAFVASRRAGFALVRNVVFNVTRLILPFILVISFHSFGIFGSFGLATAAGFLVALFIFLPRVQPGYRPAVLLDKKTASETLRYSFLNYAADLCGSAPAFILPILIVNRLGAEDNAFFYMAWAINSIVAMIPNTVSTSFFAEGSHDRAGIRQHFRRSLVFVYLLLVPVILLVVLLADKLLLLYGHQYSENATALLRILPFAAVFLTVNHLFFGMKRVENKIRPIILINFTGAVVAVGVTFLLMASHGITAAGIGWVSAQAFVSLTVLFWWLSDRKRKAAASPPQAD